ncbi:hypothetical protein [Haliscomenobacter sp.]|uniref:hypothetical protein n=1 Tax=Haliscomenobacter sp. TaxID=2717303 RepID=UPI003364B8F0
MGKRKGKAKPNAITRIKAPQAKKNREDKNVEFTGKRFVMNDDFTTFLSFPQKNNVHNVGLGTPLNKLLL